MDPEESSKSIGKKITLKRAIRKAINWLQEAIKRTFTGHSRSTWVWILLFIIILIIRKDSFLVFLLNTCQATLIFFYLLQSDFSFS